MGTKITIIDGVCGSGKSQGIIKQMKEQSYKKWICFTQFISECHRFAGTQPISKKNDEPKRRKDGTLIYDEPSEFNCSELEFKHPLRKGRGQKKEDLIELLKQRENIVTTHQMLTNIGSDVQELISELSYVAVLDEVVDPIQEYKITSNNKKELFEHEYVYLADDGVTLCWNYEKYPNRKNGDNFYKEKQLIDSSNLILLDNSLYLWEMSESLFNSFTEVYILTYQFEGSPLMWFFKAKGIKYEVQYKPKPNVKYGDLINIIEDERLNSIGDSPNFLSSNRTRKLSQGETRDLKATLNHLRKRVWNDGEDKMWTCLGSAKDDLGVNGWKKGFVPFNIRGSNDYRQVKNCAYLFNVFLNPNITKYFSKYDVTVDENTYALNSLLQWLFRSRLRDCKSINIYIPSKRMRELLKEWCRHN